MMPAVATFYGDDRLGERVGVVGGAKSLTFKQEIAGAVQMSSSTAFFFVRWYGMKGEPQKE